MPWAVKNAMLAEDLYEESDQLQEISCSVLFQTTQALAMKRPLWVTNIDPDKRPLED